MAHIADLAPYDYDREAPDALAVGWLDESAPFATGACPEDVTVRLVELAAHPVRLMRGYHYCQFCWRAAPPPQFLRAAPDVAHGNGEIWITATDGTIYAAPVLIAHYIDAHSYLPPIGFVEAVRTGAPTEGLS
ncbi:hypothetical protein [Cellulomonas sp. URHE0023]|uniref:DUF7919 family protein n=1 Tax=Cellulomonas sp. URHE0023 TaxID=1380354 RepID=UPI0004874798|nr:hypothetical protein [Cellulomonas sp. URHE0023]